MERLKKRAGSIPAGLTAVFAVILFFGTLFAGALPAQAATNPEPTGSVSFAQATCDVPATAAVTSTTVRYADSSYAGIYVVTISNGARIESASNEIFDDLGTVNLTFPRSAPGTGVMYAITLQLDTPIGDPPLVVIATVEVTQPTQAECDALNAPRVTPAAPKVTDQVITRGTDGKLVTTSGSIAPAATPNVLYTLDGAPLTGPVPTEPGSYHVVASAAPGYVLTAPLDMSVTVNPGIVPPLNEVTPAAPKVTDQVITRGTDGKLVTTSASIAPAVTTCVEYLLDDRLVTAVTPVEPGTYSFVAQAKKGCVLSAQLDPTTIVVKAGIVPPLNEVTPVAPVVVHQTITRQADGSLVTVPGSVTPVAAPNVLYTFNNAPITGTVSVEPGTYPFTASAAAGSVLSAPLDMSVTVNPGIVPPLNEVTPAAPTVVHQTITRGTDGKLVTTSASIAPAVTVCVEYLLDDRLVTAVTPVEPGTYSFVAQAKKGCVLSAQLDPTTIVVKAGVVPPTATPPAVTPPVATPVVPQSTAPAADAARVIGPLVQTDRIGDSPWGPALLFGGFLLIGLCYLTRKVQTSRV